MRGEGVYRLAGQERGLVMRNSPVFCPYIRE